MTVVNKNEFAQILGYSSKWVSELIEMGMPSISGGGRGKAIKIETQDSVKWIIEREVKRQVGEAVKKNSSPTAGTKEGEELLLTHMKRRKAEVGSEKVEGSVIEIEELAQFMYSIASTYVREMNGLGARVVVKVAPENDPAKCQRVIDDECRRIRSATADKIATFVDDYVAKQSQNTQSETNENGSGVGN